MSRAVVLLSGGLDSTTALAWALAEGFVCITLSIDYGQRHRQELEAAQRLSRALGAIDHRIVQVDLRSIGGSALTDDQIAVPEDTSDGIPETYVPARNTVMLSLALALAETLDAANIVAGMNAVDYSGYPDCRSEYLAAFEQMATLATRAGVEGALQFRLHTPLLELTKSEIIQLGVGLGVDYGQTLSCYQPDAEGQACGRCDSCRFRREGFREAGISDPTRYIEP